MPSSSASAQACSAPPPPSGSEREPARIVPLPDRHEADALRHLGVDDAMDAERRLLDREAERARDHRVDRLARQLGRQLEACRQRNSRGRCSPARRRHRSRSARCRRGHSKRVRAPSPAECGPTRSAAGGIEPGDRAAAGADRVDVDHRRARDSRRSGPPTRISRRAVLIRAMSHYVPPMSTVMRSGHLPPHRPCGRRSRRRPAPKGTAAPGAPRRRRARDAAARLHDLQWGRTPCAAKSPASRLAR